ncbi:24087_t:CDS:1, partial [Racocetra persica]
DRINENEEYKNSFYVDDKKLFCTFCKVIINHRNKFLLDQHLNTSKHRLNKCKAKDPEGTSQITFDSNTCREEREMINVDLVHALIQANILLEKIDKLKLFLLKHCKN